MIELRFLWLKLVWQLYLGYREKSVYRITARSSLPAEVQAVFDEETLSRAREYSLDMIDFASLKSLYVTVLNVGFVKFHVFEVLWGKSKGLLGWGGFTPSEALTCCAYVLLMSSLNTLTRLPLDLYFNFFLEEEHGFNNLTLGFFLRDKLTVYFSIVMISSCLVYFAVKKVGNKGFSLFVYLLVLMVFVIVVYPEFVAPLFNTFSPVPEGRLRKKIEGLTSSVGFPLNRVYVLDTSSRSSHSNAYHSGLYMSKRIVLFDTLLGGGRGGLTHEEVLAITAHELGHWSCNHVLKMMSGILFLTLVVYGSSMKEFLRSLGFRDFLHPLCLEALGPRAAFLDLGLLWATRHLEAEADAFAAVLGLAPHLRRALVKVQRDNLVFPVHDWLYSSCYHNHPTLLERLQALDKYD